MYKSNSELSGFTVVELLVVIVIIGILAAATIVSYTGINKKAIVASLQTDLSSASKQLKLYYIDSGAYPGNIAETSQGSRKYCPSSPSDDRYCIQLSSGNEVQTYSHTTSTFTLILKNGDDNVWYITDSTKPAELTPLSGITVAGTAQAGQTLTTTLAPSTATVTYQWQRANDSGFTVSLTNVGTNSATYTLNSADIGKYIRVAATGTGLFVGTVTSSATAQVSAIPFTAIGNISGTTMEGEVSTAGSITPSGATVAYQWRRADTSGGTYADISGATNSTYTLVSGDVGKYIKVVAAGTGNYSGTQTSAATAAIQASPWIAGRGGTTMAGKYVYNQNSAASAWGPLSTWCGPPQCDYTGYYGSLVASNSVDFSLYPARNQCKAIGGRLPTQSELQELNNGRVTYGNNFGTGKFWGASQIYLEDMSGSDGWSYAEGFDFYYNSTGEYSSKNTVRSVRCVR